VTEDAASHIGETAVADEQRAPEYQVVMEQGRDRQRGQVVQLDPRSIERLTAPTNVVTYIRPFEGESVRCPHCERVFASEQWVEHHIRHGRYGHADVVRQQQAAEKQSRGSTRYFRPVGLDAYHHKGQQYRRQSGSLLEGDEAEFSEAIASGRLEPFRGTPIACRVCGKHFDKLSNTDWHATLVHQDEEPPRRR
jgi:hypothetical protein